MEMAGNQPTMLLTVVVDIGQTMTRLSFTERLKLAARQKKSWWTRIKMLGPSELNDML
jgi:hypothetical protein